MDALLLLKWWRTKSLIQYIFAVVAHDPSREVRRHVARSVVTSLAVLHALGDIRPGGREEPLLVVEDDGGAPKDKAKKGEGDMLVKVLKKEVGRSKQLRDSIMPIMLDLDVDHEVRWCMLKLADLIYRPAEEPHVKIKIHIPPTPISEAPPPSFPMHMPVFTPTPAPSKKPIPLAGRQTPTTLKLNLSGTLPKLKLHSPRTSAGPLPPLVPPVAPSPLAFESTPGKNGIPLPEPEPKVEPAPEPVIERRAPTPQPPPPPAVVVKQRPVMKAPALVRRFSPEQASIPLPRPKKVKPAAPIHQGMNKTTHAHCKAVLNALHRNPHANVFRLPVDPVRDNAPNYFTVIKYPMDLSTMKAKLDNKIYKDRAEFEADFKLMIQNAKTYNAPLSYVFNEAVALEKAFNDRWNKIDASASAAQALEMEISAPVASSSKPPPVPPTPANPPMNRKLSLLAGGASPGSPLETPTRVKPKPSILGGMDTTPRPKAKASTPLPVTPSPAEQKSRTPKIKLVTRPPKPSSTPQRVASPAPPPRAPSPPPPPPPPPPDPLPEDDDAADDLLLEEVLAMETESEMKKGKEKAAPLPSTPAPPPPKPSPTPTSSAPIKSMKIGKATFKIPRASTPSGGPVEKKSRPSTPSVEAHSDRERTPAVTTKVRIVGGPEGSSKPAVSVKEKRKDGSLHRDKLVPKDPFLSPLGGGPKGKVKDAAPPPAPPPTAAPPTPIASSSSVSSSSQKVDVKRCERILASLRRAENAFIFEQPVDPIKDGCPTYLDEIKRPMDLGTMGTKLRNGKYRTMDDFKSDVELIVANCRAFNPPGTFPVLAADALETVFQREWSKINTEVRKISSGDRRALVSMIDKLCEQPCAVWFLYAVDPVQQNVPDYYDIIPKRDARDLSLIKSNVESGKYDSLEALTADVYLMQANAVKFNGEYSNVAADARTFVKSFETALANFKRKRKGPEAYGGSSGTKKQKLY